MEARNAKVGPQLTAITVEPGGSGVALYVASIILKHKRGSRVSEECRQHHYDIARDVCRAQYTPDWTSSYSTCCRPPGPEMYKELLKDGALTVSSARSCPQDVATKKARNIGKVYAIAAVMVAPSPKQILKTNNCG